MNRDHLKLVLVVGLSFVHVLKSCAAAGDLKQPSLAMPTETPVALRTALLAALSDPECKFLDGHFINATTTLNYGGGAPSLNRLVQKLTECQGVEVNVTFAKGDPGGPSWIVNHSGWGAAMAFGIQVNFAASALNMEQLAVTVTGTARSPLK